MHQIHLVHQLAATTTSITLCNHEFHKGLVLDHITSTPDPKCVLLLYAFRKKRLEDAIHGQSLYAICQPCKCQSRLFHMF